MELLSTKSKSSSEVGLEGCGAGVETAAEGSERGVGKRDGMGVRLRPDKLVGLDEGVRVDGIWKSGTEGLTVEPTVKPGRENPGG